LFEILLEDESVIAVNKPGGLLTQAPLGIDSLEFRIKRMLAERGAPAGDVYLGVPHRLDRPASGVIIFAKTLKAAQKLSLQFERRFIAKTYWALVEGIVEPVAGTWIDSLKKIDGEPRTVVAEASDPAGRKAVLHYTRLGTLESTSADGMRSVPTTWLEITLETGRTHQIRVQCASRGYPLLGDDLYGSSHVFGPWSADERERLIALHARSLTFRHPVTRQDITLTAPVPQYWLSYGDFADLPLGEQRP
jgi:RluA family pseudouridine synthase